MKLEELKKLPMEELTLSQLKKVVKHYNSRLEKTRKRHLKQYGHINFSDMGYMTISRVGLKYENRLVEVLNV